MAFALLLAGCVENKREDLPKEQGKQKKEAFINIQGRKYLNQAIYYQNNGSIDYSKSRYSKIEDGCLHFFSPLDTTGIPVGKKRFITFRTSDEISEDFSNVEKIKLNEHFFREDKILCFGSGKLPKRGIIEDIVFLPSDELIDGEKTSRIIKVTQYIDLDHMITE